MDPAVEQILMAKMALDAQSPSAQDAALMGAIGGGGIGLLGGMGTHAAGKGLDNIRDALAAKQGLSQSAGQKLKSKLKPCGRMAGGLVGMILGGALGAGIRDQAIRQSPEAAILAKGQAQGLTEADEIQLARLLEQTYIDLGLA